MQFPSRRARVALLAGCAAAVAAAAPAGAAPTPAFNAATGDLVIAYAGTDDVTVATSGANVAINGTDAGVAAANVVTITVNEDAAGTAANTVDLSGVTPAAYPKLTRTAINARGGVDTLIGSQVSDRIQGGTQNDVMRGESGDDTLVWNQGEGSDTMDGGNGSDTIENNGGGGDEVFKASPLPGGMKFERITPAPFTLTTTNAEKLLNNMNGGNDTFSADLGLAASTATTVNGGDGNDRITGTDGNDTLNGGGGDDTVDGARGNDAMNGDDGNDLLIWNNGDGSDKFEGGGGNDVAQDNGAPQGDRFVVTANNGRVSAVRTNLGLFFLDIGSSETLDINGLAGDDTVDVGSGLGSLIKVDIEGGDGNDTANVRNDSAETVNGGAGTDSAVADATDALTDVESVDIPDGQAAPGAPAVPAAPAAPAAPALDTTAPAALIATKAVKVRRGIAAIRVACPAGEIRCAGTLRLIRKRATIGRVRVVLAGGQAKTFKVKLNKRGRTVLRTVRKGKAIAVRARLSVADPAGNARTVTLRVALRR